MFKLKFLFGWLRQQVHCLWRFHRPARLDVLATDGAGPRNIVMLGCVDCGRTFLDDPTMPEGEPFRLSKPWFAKLKRVDGTDAQ